jgi:hypothetical protein
MIRDKNVEWLEKRVFLPWSAFSGITRVVSVVDASADPALRSLISATAKAVEVGTATGVGGLAIGAQNDGVVGYWVFYDLDIRKQVRFRAHFTATADSGTVTWQVHYTPVQAGVTALGAPATALNTPIPAFTGLVATDNVWYVSDFGVINRNTLAATTEALLLRVRCTDATPVTGLTFLGLEVRYTPRKMAGPERNLRGARRLDVSQPLGIKLASTQEG